MAFARFLQSRAKTGWPGIIAGVLAMALYGSTLAPGLTWAHDGADGGDLLAAALTRGIPHPPGYPTYQLLLRFWIGLWPLPPAFAGNLFSAVCAALAVILLTDLIRRVLGNTVRGRTVAFVAGLAWGVSPGLWSQAVITEVYTLNVLAVVSLVWLLWRWREAKSRGAAGTPLLVAAAFILGLGSGNHLSLLLMVPGFGAWLWTTRAAPAHPHPSSVQTRATHITWLRPATPQSRSWAAVAGALLIGLATYAYLPYAAADNPPVNWGDPQTPARLWWLLSGQLYQGLVFSLDPAWLPERAVAWAASALQQYGLVGSFLAIIGLWRIDLSDRALWRLTALTALVYSLYAIGYDAADSYVYLLPVWAAGAIWLAAGLDHVLKWTHQTLDTHLERPGTEHARYTTHYGMMGLLVLSLISLPIASIANHWQEIYLAEDHAAQDFVDQVVATANPGAVILTADSGPTFALWYTLYGLEKRPDLTPVNISLYPYDWYRRTLASHHPELVEAAGGQDLPPLTQLLPSVAAHRPLYRTAEAGSVLVGWHERAEGPLILVLPPEQGLP